jgi:hypothetical protein
LIILKIAARQSRIAGVQVAATQLQQYAELLAYLSPEKYQQVYKRQIAKN